MSVHEEQPNAALLTTEDCLLELAYYQRKDLRAHLAKTAMEYLDAVYAISDLMVAEGDEPKTRRKRFQCRKHG